jgi:hypothetical protein
VARHRFGIDNCGREILMQGPAQIAFHKYPSSEQAEGEIRIRLDKVDQL